ncbi:Glycosyl transferase, family 4 [Rhodopseudomonas palustris HaA2]|uniref:Glycosyl transferase, family 4 n=1 Tax=Rhodopseudomonas palustris (strain HaA2) TaxID=316058 RepID=Q2IZP5_RHOP2|nr:glycosyltransferase family 4 protein [Rhodopseudomonas palustris]ABD06315.1 Glycosyl transferase, family 4 [Rhodopseudomonas palustris HaA2]
MTLSPGLLALVVLTTASLCCAALIVATMPLLRRYALARPNARSSHRTPTPQGAGIAVVCATLAVAGSAIAVGTPSTQLPLLLFFSTVVIAVVGAIDDIRPLPVLPRLVLQAFSVGAVVFALPDQLQLVPLLPVVVERIVLLVAGLWFVNLVNFMDGLDLITVAEIVPVSLTLVAIGLLLDSPSTGILVAAALAGSMLGFAPFNRPVAKVFLGDVGSLPIGLLLGWCLLQLAFDGHIAAAFLLPLYYLADSSITLLRRLVRREAFWRAHRSHFYQRATDNGYSVIDVVVRVFLTNLALAALAIASVVLSSPAADAVALVCGVGLVAVLLTRFARPRRSQS